jgi:preprotein translocase subunit SecA
MLKIEAPPLDEAYPERREPADETWLDRAGKAVSGRVTRAWRRRASRADAIVSRVAAVGDLYRHHEAAQLAAEASELRLQLRRHGLTDALIARAFALIREAADRTLGKRHFDVQLKGGWIMLNGMVAEMQTGEGKTLTATLAACTAALAGIPVHVVTVNDYLVERDYGELRPVYEILGIRVACVTIDMDPAVRRTAYAHDVVYCSNKTLVFDYLRDRLVLAGGSYPLHLQLDMVYGERARGRRLLLKGLHFAIVDEADSVLIDEARTPLIISTEVPAADEALVATQALELARQFKPGEDFVIIRSERRIALTEAGHGRVIDLCKALGGVWAGALRREELVRQALSALHLFVRDDHYVIVDGKVQVVDEHTGRIMADRSWSQGLHQLIECKEGLELTPRKESLARISYQRFFRRYLHLSGMTGTASEVAGELGAVYDLPVVRVATHRPSRRVRQPDRVFETEDEKWRAIAKRVIALNARQVPVLIGTRSVASSEQASAALAQAGLDHQVLNAKQDDAEAAIVSLAGEAGRITIATNMAGRGTDIKLAPGVDALGGLHIILSERHESRRIDRQLEGRCSRQGDAGHFEAVLSMDDTVLESGRGGPAEWLIRRIPVSSRVGQVLRRLWIRAAQRRAERAHSRIRQQLLRADRQSKTLLSFTGQPE